MSQLDALRHPRLMALLVVAVASLPSPSVWGQSEAADTPGPEAAPIRPAATLEEIRAHFPTEIAAPRDRNESPLVDGEGTVVDEPELTSLLDSLGAPEFAVRERAAGRLRGLGPSLLPALRQRANHSPDPEIRMRASELADQMTRTDLEKRVATFLDGVDVGFEGWPVVRDIFGDSPSIRELFVEIRDAHPDLVVALAATARERERALESVMLKVQRGLFVERVLPTRADMIAMLLLSNDLNVPLSKPVETLLLRTLRFPSAREILNDPHVGQVCSQLLVGYCGRTSLTIRGDLLWLVMELEVAEALPIAVETLAQATQPMALVTALQTVARFGTERELTAVQPLFDNQKTVTERGLVADDQVRTTVGDAALATAAILLKVRMTELGFPASAEHPRFGFLPDDIGLDTEANEVRDAIRGKIERMIADRDPEKLEQNEDAP